MFERTTCTLVLIFLLITAFGQELVVSTPKQRLLPLENHVEICVNGYSFESLYATNSNGTIRKTERGFVIHPEKPGNTAVKVFSISGADTVYIGTEFLRVHSLVPYIDLHISGNFGGIIAKDKLLNSYEIRAELINQDISLIFPISKYRLIIMRGDSLVHSKTYNSNRFDTELKNVLMLTKSGDYLYFLDVEAKNIKETRPDYSLDGVTFTIE